MILRSITISNIRRFAEKQRIEFGAGATILLAPNGTGKTAVFEAIELALTGAVSRLGNNLDTLVRDRIAQATVQLDFDDAVIREITLTRGCPPKESGDLTKIFGSVEKKDIPYLLRLTHLLEQRDRNWFVQIESQEAGVQLATLPIGRDGARANSVLTGAKKAATEKHNETKRNLNEAQEKLAKWKKLLEERNTLMASLGRPLVHLDELSKQIRNLSAQIGIEVWDEKNVAAMVVSLAEVSHFTNQKIETIQARADAVAMGDGIFESFIEATQAWEQIQAILNQAKAIRVEAEKNLILFQSAFDVKESVRSNNEVTLRDFKVLEQRMENISNSRAQVIARKKLFTQATEAVAAAEQTFLLARKRHAEAQQTLELHQNLRSRAEYLNQLEGELVTDRETLRQWRDHLSEFDELKTATKKALLDIDNFSIDHQKAIALLTNREHEAEELKKTFDKLNAASDAIREAVGIIATQLPKDREDCPVCGQIHGIIELQRRMSKSLQAIDPSLGPADIRARMAQETVAEAKTVLNSIKTLLADAQARLSAVEDRKSVLRIEISKICSQPLFCNCDIDAANVALTTKTAEIKVLRQTLEADWDASPIEPKHDVLVGLESAVKSAASTLDSAHTEQVEASAALHHVQEFLKSAEDAMGESESADNLIQKITKAEAELAQSITAYEEARTDLDRKRMALDNADADFRRAEGLVCTATDRIREIRTQWSSIPLEGDPSRDTLSVEKLKLHDAQTKATNARKELEMIRAELVRWEATEALQRTQSAVDELLGEANEEDRMTLLQSAVKIAEEEEQRLVRGTGTLEILSTNLTKEIEDINIQIALMNPHWNSLLNRIVRDSRFTNINLNVSNRYKKMRATVDVPLHEGVVPASNVASEAQLTDIQLTFLLAMANYHRWSPWRALLLDDPTQHHDLVHASSVFDVLRDYIADYGFQVLIATHDALQARFLMRKLENDGIPAHLWTLKPTKDGVVTYLER